MPRVLRPQSWPGEVVLAEPLTLPQYHAFSQALLSVTNGKEDMLVAEIATAPLLAQQVLAGVLPCVEQWKLEKFPEVVTPTTFPATPRTASIGLLIEVLGALMEIVNGETALPLA